MKKSIKLNFINNLKNLKDSDWNLIQVVLGPRQVGKTTGVLSYLEAIPEAKHHYVSADGPLVKGSAWLQEQWLILQNKNPNGLLVIDEIQKVENWAEVIKELWDRQKRGKDRIRIILLGSSSLGIQKGLTESLTGRFFLHRAHQWNPEESAEGYDLSFEDYLRFGGYPGSYQFIADPLKWVSYIRDSIVDTVIGKDILNLTRVKSPSLFRQCFDLACSYGGQEISYTKLLGQLQDKGNVEIVKNYLDLFEGAFLLKQLSKYSSKPLLTRTSSPKILPLCPALFSLTRDSVLNSEDRGIAFEITIGCQLSRFPGRLFYWREKNDEVDFIYQFKGKTFAIEVKSGRKKSPRGLEQFLKKFPDSEAIIVTPENYREVLTYKRLGELDP